MRTKQDCLNTLHRLGIAEGDVVLIHDHEMLRDCVNQSATLIEALLESIGREGTLCCYQINETNQDPSHNLSIPFLSRDSVRDELKHFDYQRYQEIFYNQTFLALTKHPQAMFNTHPRVFMCAVGKYSQLITQGQPIDFPFGSQSGFASLKQLNAKIIYFDEDYQHAHELRLAYSPNIQAIVTEACVLGNQWVKYNDYQMDHSKYHETLVSIDKREVTLSNKKIQSVNYQYALNLFKDNHQPLFKELGQ